MSFWKFIEHIFALITASGEEPLSIKVDWSRGYPSLSGSLSHGSEEVAIWAGFDAYFYKNFSSTAVSEFTQRFPTADPLTNAPAHAQEGSGARNK